MGLGNPGKEYTGTRHNIGQMVVQHWAGESGVGLTRLKSFGTIAKVSASPAVYVAETVGYMNVSGPPAKQMATFHKIDASRVVVIHDDLDIPFPSIRLKCGGGHGGHNGVKSFHNAFGTPDFFRIRMGIGRPPGQMDPARYVLGAFTREQREELPLLLDRAKDAIEMIISDGLTAAQQRFHIQP